VQKPERAVAEKEVAVNVLQNLSVGACRIKSLDRLVCALRIDERIPDVEQRADTLLVVLDLVRGIGSL
jgi:hypothetical protein